MNYERISNLSWVFHAFSLYKWSSVLSEMNKWRCPFESQLWERRNLVFVGSVGREREGPSVPLRLRWGGGVDEWARAVHDAGSCMLQDTVFRIKLVFEIPYPPDSQVLPLLPDDHTYPLNGKKTVSKTKVQNSEPLGWLRISWRKQVIGCIIWWPSHNLLHNYILFSNLVCTMIGPKV